MTPSIFTELNEVILYSQKIIVLLTQNPYLYLKFCYKRKLLYGKYLYSHINFMSQVYRGTSLVAENPLLDLPVALVAFHMDHTQPRIPGTAEPLCGGDLQYNPACKVACIKGFKYE